MIGPNLALKELTKLKDLVKEVRPQEKLGKQGFHYDATELFELITKAVQNTSGKLLENNSNAEAIEELNESNVHIKALEFMDKNGVFSPSLIRNSATFVGPQNKSQFRLYDDPGNDIGMFSK